MATWGHLSSAAEPVRMKPQSILGERAETMIESEPDQTDEAGTRPRLAGRAEESAMLRRALDRARSGQTVVVAVDGPAGIGKSALLADFAVREAARERVRWVRCDRYERATDFAAAEILLGTPLSADRAEIDVGRMMLARYGHGDQRPGEATVLLIDDAHWMDAASARTFRFAVRRLDVEPALDRRQPAAGIAVQQELRDGRPDADDAPPAAATDPGGGGRARREARGWQLTATTAEVLIETHPGPPVAARNRVAAGREPCGTGVR